VKRTVVADLNMMPFSENPIIPFGNPVHDRLRLEVARGCTRGCRFCQAGMIYRPVRERSPQKLMSLCENSIAASGYEDISLLSLSTGDYGCIVPLMERLMARFAFENVAVSLPSLRADTLTPQLMALIKRVRKTGFTIAPEAGSQRLRDVMNKDITEKEIVDAVQDAFNLGWQTLKLYFMVGLPTETDDDLQALIDLVRRLQKLRGAKGRPGKLSVSVATFIPKPHTPFQWYSQLSLAESTSRIRFIKGRINRPGVQFKWQNPEVSRLEGLWARGDRRLSRLLITAYRKGCQFDGWSDQFQYHLWEDSFEAEGIDPDFYIARSRDIGEPLPWDHIDTRIDKSFLIREWQRALRGELTGDCRRHDCNQCGVCDFDEIGLKTYESYANEAFNLFPLIGEKAATYKKVDVHYSKQGQAAYFGHLEMVNIFLRALRRAKIPVKFTEGFHPKPKVSFDDPLPIGIESLEEHLTLTVPNHLEPQRICLDLNEHLPEGLHVHDCRPAQRISNQSAATIVTYRICLHGQPFDHEKLNVFLGRSEFKISRLNRKGKLKNFNLRDMVINISLSDPSWLHLTLQTEPGRTVRPGEVIRHIFDIAEDQIKLAKIIKLRSEAGFVAENEIGVSLHV
jgi:radical SAM-linked protein